MSKEKKLRPSKPRDRYLIALLIISGLFLASTIRYSLRTYLTPEWDEQHYMRMATEFYRMFHHFSFTTPYEMLKVVPFRQPGYPLLVLPFLLIFGLSHYYFWGLFVNGLAYIATILGIYFLSKNYLSNLSSFMASILFACYGWTLFHSHLTFSETTTSAACLLAILFLIKSDSFRKSKYSVLFGIMAGFALLTRWLSIVIISGPVLYVMYHMIKDHLWKNREVRKNLIILSVIFLAIVVYPYGVNHEHYLSNLFDHRIGGDVWKTLSTEQQSPFSIYSLMFYLVTFSQLGIYYVVLLLAELILALKQSSRLRPIMLTTLITFIFFTFFSILKGDRYIIPIYPYIAILSASVFDSLKSRQLRLAVVIVTLILSFGTFLGTDWGKGPMNQNLRHITVLLPLNHELPIYLTSVTRPPYIYKITGKEIVDYIFADAGVNNLSNPQVLSLYYYHYLDEPIMTYNLYSKDRPLHMLSFVGTVIQNPEKDRYVIRTALASDYLLFKTGLKVDTSFSEANFRVLKSLIAVFENNFPQEKYYEKKKSFYVFQDKSTVTVYKKRLEVPENELKRLEEEFTKQLLIR